MELSRACPDTKSAYTHDGICLAAAEGIQTHNGACKASPGKVRGQEPGRRPGDGPIIYYRHMRKGVEDRQDGDLEQVIRSNDALAEFCRRLQDRLQGTAYPFYVYWTVDVDELRSLHRDIAGMIRQIEDSP